MFVFLNKTCYNKLFRLNRNGEFNVPIGVNSKPKICDDVNLRAVSNILKNVVISKFDFKVFFKEIINNIGLAPFIYIEPPYTAKHGDNGFLMYNENIFSWENQGELASIVAK